MTLSNIPKFILLIILGVTISSCYKVDQRENYPAQWGSKSEFDQECPDISGTYSTSVPNSDQARTLLTNWLSCSLDARNDLNIPEHTDIEIDQISLDEINVKILKNSNYVSEFQLFKNNDEFNCTDNNEIEIVCQKDDEMYYSGYYKSRAFFSKNSEQFLVLNVKSFGIGFLLKIVPTTINESRYYRYQPTTQTVTND